MNHFREQRGALWAEEVPLSRIAEEVGTPTYVYSAATLRRHLGVVQAAFERVPTVVCYSVKANSNLAVLKRLALNVARARHDPKISLRASLNRAGWDDRFLFDMIGHMR